MEAKLQVKELTEYKEIVHLMDGDKKLEFYRVIIIQPDGEKIKALMPKETPITGDWITIALPTSRGDGYYLSSWNKQFVKAVSIDKILKEEQTCKKSYRTASQQDNG